MSNIARRILRNSLEQLALDAQLAEQKRQEEASIQNARALADSPVSDIVELVATQNEAKNAKEYVDELRNVEADATNLREAITLVNDNGGMSQEAFAMLQISVDSLTSRVGLESFCLIPDADSFTHAPKQLVSFEEINQLIDTVQQGSQRLEAGSAEAVCQLIRAISQALPGVKERLCHVEEISKARQDEIEGNVVFGDGLNIALSVNGQVPDDLVAYLQRYALMGEALFAKYIPAGFAAAMEVSTLPEVLDFNSPEAFWKTAADKIAKIEDPRQMLTQDQLTMILPNGAALFGEVKTMELPEGGNPVIKVIVDFNESRKVNDQSGNGDSVQRIEAGQSGYGRPAMALNDIRIICRSLCELLDKIDLSKYNDQSKAVRTDVIGAVSTLKGRFSEAPPEMKMLLADQFGQLVKYLDTVYLLSDWPVLNYLSNMIFTVNAFVLYAERSLILPEGGVPDEPPPPAPDATPPTDPVATDPNAAPVDPAADPSAPADGTAPDDAAAEQQAVDEQRASTKIPDEGTPATPAPDAPADANPADADPNAAAPAEGEETKNVDEPETPDEPAAT